MDKFGRNYSLRVQTKDPEKFITIEPPFSIDFNISRNDYSSANAGSIRIYNLNSKSRDQIRHDKVNIGKTIRSIELRAGYGKNIPIVIRGQIRAAFSERSGVDFITTIETFDNGFGYALITADKLPPYPAGTKYKKILLDLIALLPDVDIGFIADVPGELKKAKSLSGSVLSNISIYSNYSEFIDNGKIFILEEGQYREGPVKSISVENGLLGTPRREEAFVRFDMLFEPDLVVNQKITLVSSGTPELDGEYLVTAVSHSAMISPAVAGSATTKVSLIPIDLAKGVINV